MVNAYDIETFTENNFHIPYCVVLKQDLYFYNFYYYEKKDIIIDSIYKIFEKLKNKNKIFYIHNLNFDGCLILSSITKINTFKFKVFMKDLSIYYIRIFLLDAYIEFKCSFKLLPNSLKSIAKTFNLKEKMIFPYKFSAISNLYYIGKIPNKKYFNSDDEWIIFKQKYKLFDFKLYSIEYCENDVKITSDFVKILENIVASFKIKLSNVFSAPALSLKIFIKIFNKNRIQTNPGIVYDSIIRKSYKGGRCEVYGNPYEKDFIFHYDFSGMYALSMKEKFCYGKWKIEINNLNIDTPGFYNITFFSNIAIPVIPHYNKKNNKLLFSNGLFTETCWFEEIILAEKMGVKIIKINFGVIFEKYDYIFDEYVKFFTDIRQKGGDYKIFGKLMINSLYGRFGMNNNDEEFFFIKENEYEKVNSLIDIISVKKINDMFFIKAEKNQYLKNFLNLKDSNESKESVENNVGIASSITSKARVRLYKAQQEIIKNNGRLLYSDTDSVVAAYKINVINQKHGEIFWDPSKKDTIILDAVFISPKTYGLILQDKSTLVKIKGFYQNSIKFTELKEKFYSNIEKIEIHDFLYLSKQNFLLETKIIEKILQLQAYDKRKFSKNKKETFPYYRNKNYIYK